MTLTEGNRRLRRQLKVGDETGIEGNRVECNGRELMGVMGIKEKEGEAIQRT